MENQVKYTVSVHDLLSGKLEGMNTKAKSLEGTLGGLGKSLLGGLATIGVGFAAFKGFELMGEGVEKVHELHQAQAQVKAGLESTAYAAGITADELDKMATSTSKNVKYSRADITSLQSLMLTFPAIVKDTFPEATNVILDMSTRLGQDTKSSAIQLGKALQDPIRGITALRRVGVNFTESQQDVIQKLVETGKTAQAQKLILKELELEFGGSAKAAFDADPLSRYNKQMGSMKMAMGEMGIAILEVLAPALEWLGEKVKTVANFIKDGIHWMQKNKETLTTLAEIIGIVGIAYLSFVVWQELAIIWAQREITWIVLKAVVGMNLATVTGFMTTAQMALNAAMTANPIGLIIVAIGALIAIVMLCWEKFAGFRGFVMASWEVIKAIVDIIITHFTALKDVIAGVFTMDIDQVAKGLGDGANNVMNAGTKLANAAKKGWDDGMKDFAKDNPVLAKKDDKKGVKGLGAIAPVTSKKPETKKASTQGVTGSKSVTVNVTIGNLVNDFKIQTTNIKEGTSQLHDMIVQTLTGAINDSQIVAEG
jgi:Prophage tail length tape measure protein